MERAKAEEEEARAQLYDAVEQAEWSLNKQHERERALILHAHGRFPPASPGSWAPPSSPPQPDDYALLEAAMLRHHAKALRDWRELAQRIAVTRIASSNE